ncbi:PAS domain-containing two-component system sensor histidine kinase [Burkholderia lata]|uniref:PAS domain S-box protein n=1 Tax=Burkholderia lata (strain ATCC 17760 / DSM 23089 / LMG 22485 / NCIMB 9086 / R18194 / 383) TaxID=482957 RepID=UPI001454105B|nr:PAS domain S-box protein [Burkholderia lata]VWB37384.1 PAS domain-containing two-component system sensor histidine kinase [Burkholderia lata]
MLADIRRTTGQAIDLGLMLDALPAPAWTALPDGRIDFVNRRWLDYAGHGPGQPPCWCWEHAMSEDDRPAWRARWVSILDAGEPGEAMVRVRRADGEIRWFVIQASPIRDAEGTIVRWCAVANDVDELQRAREALTRRVLDFQLIVDSIPVPVAVTTPTGEVEGLNRLTLDYFGKSLDELKCWKSDDVVHPDDLDATIAAQTNAHMNGEAYNVESRHRRADGVYRWYNVRGFPLRDTQGRILRWFHLLIDIEERKRAEDVLRASERSMRKLIDGIPCFIIMFSADGEVTGLNRYFFEYYGGAPDGFRNWRNNGAIHADDVRRVSDVVERAFASGSSYEFECRVRRFDGAYRWFHSRGAPAQNETGSVTGWYAILTDIDDRKRAEIALAASERSLNEIINAIPAQVWSARLDGSAEYFNRHYLDYVGREVSESQDWGWTASVHPDDLGALGDIWQSIRTNGSPGVAEARLKHRDGQYRWFLFRASPLRDRDGHIVKWYGINTDIDDRKRAEEALGSARSELAQVARIMSLGALTASIAHEVNQPLSGIVTNASTCLRMLGTEPPNVEGARETARRTIRDGNRAADVIARLRTLFSKRCATIEAVDLNAAAREVIVLLRNDLDRARVIVRTEFAGALPCIGCDRVQVQQVIMNLLRNAADAMSHIDDRPRCLLIRTESEAGSSVCLTVRDWGVGFEPCDAERLFDTFYTTKCDGMGIGLAISRTIIESHHGRLWAAVPDDGPGASFTFSIPAYDES